MQNKFWTRMFVFTVLAITVACGSESNTDGGTAQALETDFVALEEGDAQTYVGYPARVEGTDNVEIKAQVSGYLQEVLVKEGQFVQKGQLLFKINPAIFEEQVNTNQAALKTALANQANALLEVEKIRPLVEGGVVSDLQLRTAQAAYDAASAQVAQARAAVGSSRLNADFTHIKAPVSGFIGRIPNRIGNLVTPADVVPLTNLSDITRINAYFAMNEAEFITYQRAGMDTTHVLNSVEFILADGSTYPITGTLENASGIMERNLGSMAMKAVFANPDKLIRAGATGKVRLNYTLHHVLTIPKTAVKDIQDMLFVFKLTDGGVVNMVPIRISGGNATQYFVSSGLRAGDKIAINRMDVLTENMPVKATIAAAGK
ncbi:efflux RND transporter periplasmic adaptor subunit [Sphingobacterium sp. Mn56C]|uniref:efflux RND transporter periplasmic adaptor subunit n=1 Tax=Sphingobacterium sp. Mn56C TaxID=3395261 RepID=UPI003BC937A2